MTTDSTSTDEAARRDASALQRGVRPRAWEVRQGSRTYYVSDAEFVRGSYDSGSFTPLYDESAVAAEREHVPIPASAAEAKAMATVAIAWLREHAPDELRPEFGA